MRSGIKRRISILEDSIRKTDVNDAQWLQQLHQHGLLRGSFHPRAEVAQLRTYLRLRERMAPTAKHFTSWLTLAPGNKISGGRVLSSKTRRSSNRAAALLRIAAVTILACLFHAARRS
jgi:hypothetical protein